MEAGLAREEFRALLKVCEALRDNLTRDVTPVFRSHLELE